MPSTTPSWRLTVALLTTVLTTLPGSTAHATPSDATPATPPAAIDDYARYEPQRTCASTAQPGVTALAAHIVATWPQYPTIATMRSCGTGGGSEHKDGRALDWMVDVGNPVEHAAGYGLIDALLAPDADGNAHALARRMGVMYLIYDDTIWSAYRGFEPRDYRNAGCKTRRGCSRTLRHLDHVHVSLSHAGGAALTSWYGNPPTSPAPVAAPVASSTRPVLVAASGRKTRTSFLLAANTTYRVTATGTVHTNKRGRAADAVCSQSRVGLWKPTVPAATEATAPSPRTAPLPHSRGILVNNKVVFPAVCSAEHAYTATVRFIRARRLRLRFTDPTPSHNSGAVTVWVTPEPTQVVAATQRP